MLLEKLLHSQQQSEKIKVKENTLAINLIQDGEVIYENLKIINKNSSWLDKKIKEKGYKNYKEIFLLKYKNDQELTIYDYEKKT